MSKIDGDIFKLEEQLKKVKSKLADLNNAKREEEKKILLRKQMIVGKMVIDEMHKSEEFHTKTLTKLSKILTRKIDRELFSIDSCEVKLSDEISQINKPFTEGSKDPFI